MINLLNLSVFYILFSNVQSSFVPTTKICKNCKHFIGDSIKCRKFGDINLITGEITYNSAISVRADEKKCGKNGFCFEKNYFKIITVPYYYIKKNWSMILFPGILLILYIYCNNTY